MATTKAPRGGVRKRTSSAVVPADGQPVMSQAERDQRVVEMRTRGVTFAAIGVELGIGTTTAHDAYVRGLNALPRLVETQRELFLQTEAARLDELQRALWAGAMRGDPETVRAVLLVMKRRAELFGLNAPTKTEHRVTSELDAEIERLVEQLGSGRVTPAEVFGVEAS